MPFTAAPDDPLEPKLQYQGLTEHQLLQARADKSDANLVALELGRLLFAYCNYVEEQVKLHGYTPEISDFLHAPARRPIEKVAKEMALTLISARTVGKPQSEKF